jgi:hypothetical protein
VVFHFIAANALNPDLATMPATPVATAEGELNR